MVPVLIAFIVGLAVGIYIGHSPVEAEGEAKSLWTKAVNLFKKK